MLTRRVGKKLKTISGDLLKHMIVITDRHSVCFALKFIGNQVCLAHFPMGI